MKRSGPPRRKTPLRAKAPLRSDGSLERTPLRKRSAKRQKHMTDERIPLIEALIEAGFGCEIGPVFAEHGIEGAENCRGRIEGLHERRKRSAGGSLTNHDNLIPACNWCNGAIEDRPVIARELGLVVREGDPEWERLGARHDRASDVPGDDDR